MSQYVPETRPSSRAALSVLRTVGAVLLLVVVLVRTITIVSDYRGADGAGAEDASATATGTVEATEAPGGAEGSGDEQETRDEDGDAETGEVAAPGEAQAVVVLIPGLNFRTEPKSNSEVMRTLSEGTRLTLLGEQNGWYQVRDDDGVTGWVSSSPQYVTVETE